MTENIVLAPGVTLRAMQTDKFKTACFSVNFLRPHCAGEAAADALLPSVLLRATERYPDIRSISVRLDELYGATFGTLLRRKGEVKLVGFYADFIEEAFLPEGEEVFVPMTEFLEQVLYHPLTESGVFTARAVEGEKQNLINAIESELNDKRTYAVTKMLRTMCAGEAYGVPRLGDTQNVRAITPESLWAHYQKVLTTSRVEIFYAGRRSPQEAAAIFSRVFAGHGCLSPVPARTEVIRCADAVREFSEAMDVTQGKLAMGFRTGGLTCWEEDYPALVLCNAIFGGTTLSKLFLNVREKLSLCYYASSVLEKMKGLVLVSSGIEFDKYQQARDEILAQLDNIRSGKIEDWELEGARRTVISGHLATLDDQARQEEFWLGQAAAGLDETAEELAARFEAVTREQVMEAARKLELDTIYFLKGKED